MKIDLKKKLNGISEISAWQYNINKEESHQLYLVKDKVEAFRKASTQQVEVIIYKELRDGRLGEATFYFTPVEEFQIDEKIERALYISGLTGQKPFKIAGPVSYPKVPLTDEKLVKEPEKILGEFQERIITAVEKEPHVELSSSECYISKKDINFANSRGCTGNMTKSEVSWDFVLLSGENLESESWYESSCSAYNQLNIEEKIKEYSAYARDNRKTRLPKTLNTAVIVNAKALYPFLEPILSHSSGKFIYEKISSLKKGEALYKGDRLKGDGLNIKSNPLIPYGLKSFSFDRTGIGGTPLKIIKDSKLENIWATKRYASYLNTVPTGALGNLEIEKGKTPLKKLMEAKDKPVYHIVKFSLLLPDPVSGDFATEIRFGYEITPHGERIPIKGGSVSGNIFELLSDIKLSDNIVMEKNYIGPEAIRFEDVSISGT